MKNKKTVVIKVWGVGKKELWSYEKTVDIPDNFGWFAPGNSFLTQNIKKLSDTIYEKMVKDGNYSTLDCYYADQKIIDRVKKLDAETRENRQRTNQKKQQSYFNRVEKKLIKLYPLMPAGDRERILTVSFSVGASAVGRSTTIDLTEKSQRAVWAHIRHRYTDYDELMRREMNESADSTLGWNCEERQEKFDP